MMSPEITFLGLALAIDAAVVSFAMGLLTLQMTFAERLLRGMIITVTFGIFQFLMLWLGSYGGYLFTFSAYGYLSQTVVALIFFLIGLKFFKEASTTEKRMFQHGIVPLLLLGVATSIDALAAGVGLGAFPNAHRAAMEVGGITFILCGVFYGMSQFLSRIPEKWMLYFAGGIFAVLAMKIVVSQAGWL